ncbi:MAG: TIGR01459 family HAD-type hydrolase [Pseudomonadota bacterium]
MTALSILHGLSEIADDYDALLCDAWGVIHNGRALFDGVVEALQRFREQRGPVIILTNAPKPSAIIPGQLDRLGLPRDAYDAVVTSGEATRAEIAKRLPARAYAIGWTSDTALYEGLSIAFDELDAAGFIVCTGIAEEGPSEPDDYRSLLKPAAAAGKTMICANPDIVVNWRGELMWCAGAVARVYEDLGGPVVYAGKPYPAVYELALQEIAKARGAAVSASRILAVGDGAGTDILGANQQGIDAVYVAGAGGVHTGDATPEDIAAALKDAGATARAATSALKW